MRKLALFVVLGVLSGAPVMLQTATPALAADAAKGDMLVDANGRRLAPVYRVEADGSVQIIIEAKMVTVPANTLSKNGGKLTTSLTKAQVIALH